MLTPSVPVPPSVPQFTSKLPVPTEAPVRFSAPPVSRLKPDPDRTVPAFMAKVPPPAGDPPGPAPKKGDLRRFSLAFRECPSGKVSIESVRLVSEKEEKLKEPSGQQWAGLADIFRATLAAKTTESIRIPLRELPEHARLDFAIGTKEGGGVVERLALAFDEAGDDVEIVLFGELAEVLGAGAGDGLGAFIHRLAGTIIGEGFGQHDEVGLLFSRVGDERGELRRFVGRIFSRARLKMDRDRLPLARILASKRAAGRPKDRLVVPVLEEVLALQSAKSRGTST